MAETFDIHCSFTLGCSEDDSPPSVQELKALLEHSSDQEKLKGMQRLVSWMASGSPDIIAQYDKLFVEVIRFVTPSKNHQVKRLTQLYWELLPMQDKQGNPRQEMLLVSQFLRNDLTHANEYIRAQMLRTVAKMCNTSMIKTIDQCIVDNLQHTFPYTRRCAATCIQALAEKFGPNILPQAIPDLENMALTEFDVAAQRAALQALIVVDPVRVAKLFLLRSDNATHLGDVGQLALVEAIKKVYTLMFMTFPPTTQSIALNQELTKEDLINLLVIYLDSPSNAVVYEAAGTLLWLSEFSPSSCKQACKALIRVLLSEWDINIRLGVIDRLIVVTRKCLGVFESFVVDVLRVLSSPSAELRQKVLSCALPAITSRTVHDAVAAIKGEIIKRMDASAGQVRNEGQSQLVRAMRILCTKFPEVSESVIDLLLDFLSEKELNVSIEVAHLVRELCISNADIRPKIILKLIDTIPEISKPKPIRMCVWMLGELCDSASTRDKIVHTLLSSLMPLPLPNPENEETEVATLQETSADTQPKQLKVSTRTIILPDGSYGTENVIEGEDSTATDGSTPTKVTGLRMAITRKKETLLAAVVGVALTKLVVRNFGDSPDAAVPPLVLNKALFVVACLVKYFQSCTMFGPSSDVVLRLQSCLRAIQISTLEHRKVRKGPSTDLVKTLEVEREAANQEQLNMMVMSAEGQLSSSEFDLNLMDLEQDFLMSAAATETPAAVEDLIGFKFLSGGGEREVVMSSSETAMGDVMGGPLSNCPELDFLNSVPLAARGRKGFAGRSNLLLSLLRPNKAVALTGYSDPIYVEVVTQVNHLDLILELLIINQTAETLQNVTVQLGTHGDLKILEKPQPLTLQSGEEQIVFATIRLNSAEAGVIFGYCGFENRSSVDKEYITLNELKVDILDCVQRAWIGDYSFRTMWAEFEWENKITIRVQNDNVMEFLGHLLRQTKMTVVGLYGDSSSARRLAQARANTKDLDLLQDAEKISTEQYIKAVRETPSLLKMAESRIFSVNLCSKSIFGEDALVNLSLERDASNKLIGSVRIRSRTQGIALSLGDRIAATQRLGGVVSA
eukprot:Gregarina_sp_Pseudo_9__1686@NODE_213_length_3590_cov_8_227260_g198_i0_p1_GENE_NODE_213_length_3590_cov_8_227260_g198_i0NODE_213_length_3590_cov_8_227260_g198_i0_p1_ORF_typecomplete_len1075_score253_56Adaptin_N/PF01602_20/2_2e64Coatomer_b_Cpla/PF14806_6/5_4e42Coatamer_beta_C/PF07718_12/3_3e31HEAT_2/PF13646_6/1_1e04HEAT_2/PF13646_6/0_00023HEAT_2/PF13646_6/1_1HEAT_2/PF13646_6/4_1e02DUF5578/PF17741_1/2_6e02DUF5578/PF17741_1/13DUF5578/PF17741_1/0_03DUF5578/PF17741_1/3_2e03Cnd1/PF12717_7/0_016Cnd1/PF1